MPRKRIPPDKVREETALSKIETCLDKITLENKNESSKVMDIETFERRFLTKPSSLESKASASNLKAVMGGKYLKPAESDSIAPHSQAIDDQDITVSSSEKASGTISENHINASIPHVKSSPAKDDRKNLIEREVIDKKRKIESINSSSHFRKIGDNKLVRLPPLHSGPLVKKPDSKLDLPSVLKELLPLESSLSPPKIMFEANKKAAEHNWSLLQNNDFDRVHPVNDDI